VAERQHDCRLDRNAACACCICRKKCEEDCDLFRLERRLTAVPRMLDQLAAVFSEYLIDCDASIEGCDGKELHDIEVSMAAARELRKRIVRHLTEGADARGRLPAESHRG
jgi:hypothetical protein